MRLLKRGPGPEGGGPPPLAGRATATASQKASLVLLTERRADRVWIGKPDPAGLEWGLLSGAAWGEGIRRREQANPGWGQEPLMPARTDCVEPSALLRGKLRPRDTEGPSAKSTGDTR